MHAPRQQRGLALIMALIMLALITGLVMSSLSMGISNVKAISNTQFRNQALAAVDAAIEQVVSSSFTSAPASQEILVDLNKDSEIDYRVTVAKPTCVQATEVKSSTTAPSSLSLGSAFSSTIPGYFITTWDLDASVSDVKTGSDVRIHQGVRVKLTPSQYAAVCV